MLWDSPFVMVLWKLFLSIGGSLLIREVGWLVAKVSVAILVIANFWEPSLRVVLVYA